MTSFDPYQQWLGIPSQMRPLNHYILLGLRIFEGDSEKITAAYEARMKLLETVQADPHLELSRQVISEIGLAKRDLLDQNRKSKYDSDLQKLLHDRQRQLEHAQDERAAESDMSTKALPAGSQSSASDSFPVLGSAPRSETSIPAVEIKSTQPDQLESIVETRSKDVQNGRHQDDGEDSEVLSVFSYLTDVRYLIALLTLSVIVMAATVKLFSPDPEQESQTLPVALETENQVPVGEPADPASQFPRIAQAADATFELPIQRVYLTGGAKSGAQGITGWNAGDKAVWMLVAPQRKKGYFNCLITYRAKSESVFEVQLGNRKPRAFTLYPHEDDFEEEFIVRLAKGSGNDEQTFRIKATQAGASEVEIKRIRLVPKR